MSTSLNGAVSVNPDCGISNRVAPSGSLRSLRHQLRTADSRISAMSPVAVRRRSSSSHPFLACAASREFLAASVVTPILIAASDRCRIRYRIPGADRSKPWSAQNLHGPEPPRTEFHVGETSRPHAR